MAVQMAFPDTWEEFEKHYGFYDSKQAYTYGNTRLIPSFRVQQWLDHIDDIKHKKQSQKNKMEQAAAMFGKKLFDTFHVKLDSDTVIARFSPYGFEWFDDHCIWSGNGELLNKLLIGQAVIVDE